MLIFSKLFFLIFIFKMVGQSASKVSFDVKQNGELSDSKNRSNKRGCNDHSDRSFRSSNSENREYRGRDWSRHSRRNGFRSKSRDKRGNSENPGMPVVSVKLLDNEVFLNDEWLKHCSKDLGQIIIVDSGCPRSLMGDQELDKLKDLVDIEEIIVKDEGFRFGPSRVYISNKKVKFTMHIGINEIECEFFVVKGNIPILLGNDVMDPLGAKIDMEDYKLVLNNDEMEIPLVKTRGGHVVIPVKSIAAGNSNNIRGDEANAVMVMILDTADNEEIRKLHDKIGHATFLALALSDDEKAQVKKVHRYFGHRSSRRIWELFSKANKLKGKKQAVIEVIENCPTCSEYKKSPPRPKVGLPVANDFNEVVGLDLKVLNKSKGEYILWMVDLFSKMIKGKFIKNKKPETIIEGILSMWVIGDGIGPGNPRRGFWSDNGGEFLNEQVLDYAAAMDVDIRMTSADSPWQNGVVERHHATADIIYEKLMKENPNMSPQDAINHAAFAKNSDTNQTGFSPIQLMTGQNPKFPGLDEANPASSNLNSCNKYMKTLKAMDSARVKMREIDCDVKLRKVMSERINPNVERNYKLGDPIFFYDDKRKEWKKGTALIKLGKTIYLRYGNFLRRVASEKVRPDPHGEARKEESYVDHDDENDEARFMKDETPVEEMAEDLTVADERNDLKKQVKELQEQVVELKTKILEEKTVDDHDDTK